MPIGCQREARLDMGPALWPIARLTGPAASAPVAVIRVDAKPLPMIDLFRTYLPQIIGYAGSVLDGTIQKAWADGDLAGTSVYYSGELYEQVFEDLDSESMSEKARVALGVHSPIADGLESFLSSLKRLDDWIEAHVDTVEWGKGQTIPTTVARIFDSQEWRDAHAAAAVLVVAAGGTSFSSKDSDAAP